MASRPSGGAQAGLISLGAKFATLSRSLSASELVKALRLGGLIIANEAKIRAPVLSGQLRRSIAVSTLVICSPMALTLLFSRLIHHVYASSSCTEKSVV